MLRMLVKRFFRLKVVHWLLLMLVWFYIVVVGKTSKYCIKGEENIETIEKSGQPFILAVWHGRMIIPMYYLRDKGIYALASSHRRSAWAFHCLLEKFGWRVVKGTSRRGGAQALIELIRKLREGYNVVLTPDGPSGPPEKLKPGLVYLAQKTGAPIIPIGISSYPRKRLKTWDKFLLPGFFAHSVLLFGKPFVVEKDLDEESINQEIANLEHILSELQAQAEQIAITRS